MRRGAALLVVTATLLAACSDDGPSDTTPDTTTAATSDSTARTAPDTTSPGTTTPGTTAALEPAMVGSALVVGGLTKPVEIAWRAGDATMFVVQQDGRIVPVVDGVAGSPVLDLSDAISTGNEQGLLGMAFHPAEPLAYVDYTDTSGDTIIAEYAVGADGTFDPASARVVLKVDQPYGNHNGGEVVFDAAGLLYIGLGDGGSGGDPERRGLDLGTLLGKILRIDPLPAGDAPYSVPDDNPFVGVAGALPEIWAYGLRNPWRFDFDAETGDLWIGDVGQNEWEEVDLALAADGAGRGVNFGWSAFEGTHRFNDDQPEAGAVPPIFEYPHTNECSISGGTVYRGTEIASLVGWYVFADYCSGDLRGLQTDGAGALVRNLRLTTLPNPSAIVDGPDGTLYVLAHLEGSIYRLVAG